MFKIVINPKEINTDLQFLENLHKLELIELYKFLFENKHQILLNLDNEIFVTIESNDWVVTMLSRKRYFMLITSIQNTKGFIQCMP